MLQHKYETTSRQGRDEHTPLHGLGLLLARLTWAALFTACLGSFIAGLSAHLDQLLTVSDSPALWMQLAPNDVRVLTGLGLDIRFYAYYLVVFEILAVASFAVLSLFIFWRRS